MEHSYHTWGMPVPLTRSNGVVPGSRKPLPNMGCGKDSFDRITRSQTKGDTLGDEHEHDAGFVMDRRKCYEISGVTETNGRINIRYRLQQET